jgi:hypothetical protein
MGSISLAEPDYTVDQKKKAFVLYAALNLNRRKGPYFDGAASIIQVPAGTSGSTVRSFPAYADGWGRMILYDQPPTSGTRRRVKPLMTSKGVQVGSTSDDLNNYKD